MTADKKTSPSVDTTAANYATYGDYSTFAAEESEDRRTRNWAIVGAVIFHLIFLIIQLPEIMEAQDTEKEKAKVFVIKQVQFKPPPPQQKKELPKPRAKKVPIPDPTPDEPEPIRDVEEIEPDIDLPDTDVIFGVPEGPPPSEPTGPILVGGDVKPPEKLYAPQPQYTEIARKARIQGVVIVQAIIDKTGMVTNVKVLKGLPMGLEQAAAEAVKKWKFNPATLNGKPVAVYYNLTINYRLQ